MNYCPVEEGRVVAALAAGLRQGRAHHTDSSRLSDAESEVPEAAKLSVYRDKRPKVCFSLCR